MARTDLASDYQLDADHLTPDQLKRALSGDLEGFRYFFENCMQLQDKETRQLIHPKLNKGQELIADTILKHVAKDTRANTHKEIVIAGPRQFGKSTLITAISNYMAAYVSGLERSSIVHTLQTSGAASKYYNQKMAPIVTGVHPDIFPTINRKSENNSTQLLYKDVKGIPRGTYYEILSAGSNSVRSGTVTVWLCDEPSEYRNPDVTEDAISGAIPDHGFSFTAYIGTFSDRVSSYFTDKIQKALDNPEEMELIFVPWFLVYGGEDDILNFTEDDFTDYDKNVIVPELRKYGYVGREALGKVAWYHRRALRTTHMRYEFPTSIEDIMALTKDRCFFSEDVRKMQESNIIAGTPMTIKTDQFTKKPEMSETEQSAFIVFKKPQEQHKYRLVVDAITSMSGESDFFSMMVFDEANNEQCATFYDNGLALEDYADYAVQIAKIYNRAMIVPEQNMAEGFIALVWEGQRYYNFYFQDNVARAKRMPGIRTTASSRTAMLDSLTILLETGRIILHDQKTLDEMGYFERKVKHRQDGTESVRIEARAGHHDDRCFAGDTLVRTDKGDVKIRNIRPGDKVLTSKGYRKVLATSSRLANTITKFGTTATPDHPYITTDGIQEFTNTNIHSKIYVCPTEKKLNELLSNIKGRNTIDTLNLKDDSFVSTIGDMISGSNHQSHFIGRFMKTIMGLFQRVGTSIISTIIQKITTYLISKLSPQKSIIVSRVKKCGRMRNGEKRGKICITLQNSEEKYKRHKRIVGGRKSSANYVEKFLKRPVVKAMCGIVLNAARCGIVTGTGCTLIRKSSSNGLEELLYLTSRKTTIMGTCDKNVVYNLTVEGAPEFYANGVLVHNCSNLWIYAGSLDRRQIAGQKNSVGWAVA